VIREKEGNGGGVRRCFDVCVEEEDWKRDKQFSELSQSKEAFGEISSDFVVVEVAVKANQPSVSVCEWCV